MRAFDSDATSLRQTATGRVLRLASVWIVALTLLMACGQASPPATDAEPKPAPPPVTEAPDPAPATEAPEPPPVAGPGPSPPATAGPPPAANGGGIAGAGDAAETEDEPEVPQFPWPPPRASASVMIPDGFIRTSDGARQTLGEVEAQIRTALDAGGYVERSYFAAPGGFAMVTRLERIQPDGTPMTDEAERWRVDAQPLGSFSLGAYLRALFTAPAGHYRIIVFVVSSEPFAQAGEVTRSEALAWLHEGLNRLPDSIGRSAYTDRHAVTALIYEFEQPGRQEAVLVLPGNLTGRTHLERAMLWQALGP